MRAGRGSDRRGVAGLNQFAVLNFDPDGAGGFRLLARQPGTAEARVGAGAGPGHPALAFPVAELASEGT